MDHPIFRPALKAAVGVVGRDDGVHLLECLDEIVADQRADFLRAQVIGIVIAAAQHVGAENDATLHFCAETRTARFGVKLDRISAFNAAP